MKLFLLTQSENSGYDTYDSAVVCAVDEESAKKIHPSGHDSKWWQRPNERYSSWATSLDRVHAQYLGEALDAILPGVICASFNAG